MKRANRLQPVEPLETSPAVSTAGELVSRTVKLTPRFLACAASWFLTPEELARRVCEDFELRTPPGPPIIFIEDARKEQP